MTTSLRTGRQPVRGHVDDDGALRVFAIQYRLDIAHAVSYESYRAAMRELMDSLVVPNMVEGRPTLVVFPEAVGLPTVAIGARGAAFRALPAAPATTAPAALSAGMAALGAAYERQIVGYVDLFGEIEPRSALLLAATDTAARAFSKTFSDIATDYGVWVVAGNYQPTYRATTTPEEVATFGDPEVDDGVAYVATSPVVTNATFLWSPEMTNPDAPTGETNLVVRNEKIPLTEMELEFLGLSEGPARGEPGRTNAGWVDVAGFRVGFATSLPAFAYGYPFGARPEGFDPFADLNDSYAAAQDALGVEVMIQADANPGPWAFPVESGAWQPLEWMSSTWRAVADPTVDFRYNVTPMMTGNLVDLMFDGQSSITARDVPGTPARFVGNSESGTPEYDVYAGDKSQFLAVSDWLVDDAPRDELVQLTGALSPGSGHLLEGQYIETAIFADLVHRA